MVLPKSVASLKLNVTGKPGVSIKSAILKAYKTNLNGTNTFIGDYVEECFRTCNEISISTKTSTNIDKPGNTDSITVYFSLNQSTIFELICNGSKLRPRQFVKKNTTL